MIVLDFVIKKGIIIREFYDSMIFKMKEILLKI